MNSQPFVSVIIPVHNGGKMLERCLDALHTSSYREFEIIVVDDASTDDSSEIGRAKGTKVVHLTHQSGPAAARNLGAAEARGDVLLFIDADVVAQPTTISQVVDDLARHQEIDAVFGSYDFDPAEKNFLSQYKNLFHHFVHQQASSEAATFWAGCGAIRREVFEAIGGFDLRRYIKPSIEDIELGFRMRNLGYRILLDKKLQVKHLKQWRMRSLLKADIFYRAVPWSQLMLERGHLVNDLNLKTSDRVSAGLLGLSILLLPSMLIKPHLLLISLIFLILIILINYKLYLFFHGLKGLKFTTLALALHLLYLFYSGLTFMLCWFQHVLRGKRWEHARTDL